MLRCGRAAYKGRAAELQEGEKRHRRRPTMESGCEQNNFHCHYYCYLELQLAWKAFYSVFGFIKAIAVVVLWMKMEKEREMVAATAFTPHFYYYLPIHFRCHVDNLI